MHFPVSDILNNTTFGIPKDNKQDINIVVNSILTKDEKSEV